jgi:transposase
VWFFHALSAEGLPAICIDARHAKAALDMAANKTDANDADGLAHLAEVGLACQLLMSIPGVGVVTATSFATAIEDPANFKTSRAVGAWLGLTTRRYQSGEVDYDGHISRRGDAHLRGLLYEAAAVILTRVSAVADCAGGG